MLRISYLDVVAATFELLHRKVTGHESALKSLGLRVKLDVMVAGPCGAVAELVRTLVLKAAQQRRRLEEISRTLAVLRVHRVALTKVAQGSA